MTIRRRCQGVAVKCQIITCQRDLDGYGPILPGQQVSHGICPQCAEKQREGWKRQSAVYAHLARRGHRAVTCIGVDLAKDPDYSVLT